MFIDTRLCNSVPINVSPCDAMLKHNRGQIIVPTGGGKTMCMIRDAIDTIDRLDISTIVVVAPRILLAEQLCSEFLPH